MHKDNSQQSNIPDHPLNYRFNVELDGIVQAGFTEVTGLSVEIETESYQEGGLNTAPHELPKAVKFQNILLKRGVVQSQWMWDWIQKIVDGQISKKNGRIILLDAEGNTVCYWNFIEAFPVKWQGTDLKADGGEVFVETLELNHGGIKKITEN